jgi:hypothetical protein
MEVRCKFVNTLALFEDWVVNLLLWSKATVSSQSDNLVDLL